MADHALTTSTPFRRRRGAARAARDLIRAPGVAPRARRAATIPLDLRARLEALVDGILALLDAMDGDPDMEPDDDGEEDVTEASAVPLTLAPDRLPASVIPLSRRPRRVAVSA